MKRIHLVCNAHLDPVWLWPWQEGCAEALSTFRTACDLLDEFPDFVFNHNEALLYEWVEQLDSELFARIKAYVDIGRWQIIGGWYLQPDCNMPSGESIVRNMLKGQNYFRRAFGKIPKVAINFDSFGHSRGLVQPMVQAGYEQYIVCRPHKSGFDFVDQDFTWTGLDGSQIIVHRSDENYNSVLGKFAEELRSFAADKQHEPVTLCLWGVGDHGGGPSRKDLRDLVKLAQEKDISFEHIHSHPDAYFAARAGDMPTVARGLNPVAVGCYTSQIRVKQLHRKLENELYMAERMCTAAAVQCNRPYPTDALNDALRDLLLSEFHDALPGSGTQRVEEDTIRQLHHGLEICAREKQYALIALSQGEAVVEDDSSTVCVYNPHPFALDDVLILDCSLPKQNWDSTFMTAQVYLNGKAIPTQTEMEESHFCIDWRRRISVNVSLPPMSVTRFTVRFTPLEKRPLYAPIAHQPEFVFDNGSMRVVINTGTGLIDSYQVGGVEYMLPGSCQLIARDDTYNSWGLGNPAKHGIYPFRLLTLHEGSAFSGLSDQVIPSVRVIEDGEIRTVVEALFGMHDSKAYVRYAFPKQGAAFDIDAGVYWNEKDMHLKMELHTPFTKGSYHGQIMFGEEELAQGEETISQQWCAIKDKHAELAILSTGNYGSSCADGSIGLTLLRSAGFSAADGNFEKTLHEQRHTVRMEQGERLFKYRVIAGDAKVVHAALPRKAVALNMPAASVAYNPPGRGGQCPPLFTMDGDSVSLSALKRAEDGNGYILRLFEAQGKKATAHIQLPALNVDAKIPFKPFEIKTFRLDGKNIEVCPLLEQ